MARAGQKMTAPIVIHAGFHKTGTSTVQAFLKANRPHLKPHMAIVLKPRIRDVLHAARGYSTWRDPLTLAKFAHRIETVFAGLPGVRRRGLILSAEELCGHMPGRDGIDDYSAAPVLLTEIAHAAERIWGRPDLHFVLTTRARDAWLESSYWEHVKSSSMTEDFADYAARIGPGADLSEIAARVAQAVAPFPVHDIALDTGPADPILGLFDLPDATWAALTPVPARNARLAPETLQRLLEINRTISDRTARKLAKQALLQQG